MSWTDLLSPAIVIAVVVLSWRQTNGRLDTLTATVADIDQRLATIEGRISGWQDRPHPTPASSARD